MGTAKRIGAGTAKRIARLAGHLTVALLALALVLARPGRAAWAAAAELGAYAELGDTSAMRRRTDMDRLVELVRLHRMGTGARDVARLLGMGPNTERQYREALRKAGVLDGAAEALPTLEALKAAVQAERPPVLPQQQTSTVAAWESQLATWLAQGLGPRAMFDRLRLEHPGFEGSYAAIKRLCRAMTRARGVQAEDVAIPVETEAGEIAQVDFGYVGRLLDPETHTLRKAWCFVMVLGHSRHLVARVVFDQRTETWLRLHVEAFAELGGVPRTVVPDNLKAAVVRAAFAVDQPSELNRSYRELARHYGFKVDPAPPRDPAKKGKVEAGVKYVKGNFFAGREASDVTAVRAELRRWCAEIAATRCHGTTGKRPIDVFTEVERGALMPLPEKAYEEVVWKKARVHRDAHVAFERRLYSVPWKHIGKDLWMRASSREVIVYADDERVATHDRAGRGYRSTVDAHLPDHRVALRHRSRAYWEERAAAMGEPVVAYVRTIFDADDVLSQLRTVQAVVAHLETFPPERAQAACARAAHFGNFGYGALKTILRQALDLQAPETSAPVTVASAGRFARPPSSWKEARRELH